jgi:hypothetical protein
MVSDVQYLSIIFDPDCPKCGRKWSTFYSDKWPQNTNELNLRAEIALMVSKYHTLQGVDFLHWFNERVDKYAQLSTSPK